MDRRTFCLTAGSLLGAAFAPRSEAFVSELGTVHEFCVKKVFLERWEDRFADRPVTLLEELKKLRTEFDALVQMPGAGVSAAFARRFEALAESAGLEYFLPARSFFDHRPDCAVLRIGSTVDRFESLSEEDCPCEGFFLTDPRAIVVFDRSRGLWNGFLSRKQTPPEQNDLICAKMLDQLSLHHVVKQS